MVPFVARQVEPEPHERDAMEAATGERTIPVLVLEDGTTVGGDTDEILDALDRLFPRTTSPSTITSDGSRRSSSSRTSIARGDSVARKISTPVLGRSEAGEDAGELADGAQHREVVRVRCDGGGELERGGEVVEPALGDRGQHGAVEGRRAAEDVAEDDGRQPVGLDRIAGRQQRRAGRRRSRRSRPGRRAPGDQRLQRGGGAVAIDGPREARAQQADLPPSSARRARGAGR